MSLKLELKTDFSPEEDVDFIERLSSSAAPEIHYDLEEKVERYPHLRERFRYEAKKRGEYTPSRSLSFGAPASMMPMQSPQMQMPMMPGQMMPGQMPMMYPGVQYPQMRQQVPMDPEKQMLVQTTINPDTVFNDPNGKKQRYYIMNTRDNAVFVSIGNKEENSWKCENFSHLGSIPDNFFDYHGFRECFYGPNPALIFLTEEQYRQRKDIVLRREEMERQRREQLVDRVQMRGGHAGSRDEGAYGDPYESYSNMAQQAQGEVVNGIYLYGQAGAPLPGMHMPHAYGQPSISETMDIGGGNMPGLSDILAMAQGEISANEDGLIPSAELNSILNSMQ